MRFVNQPEPRVHIPAPHNHSVECTAVLFDLQGPSRAAWCVTRRLAPNQYGVAEFDLVAVMEHTVDFSLGIGAVSVREVERTAAFHHRHVAIHHHVFRSRLPDHSGAAGVVIPMSVADQQDPSVAGI